MNVNVETQDCLKLAVHFAYSVPLDDLPSLPADASEEGFWRVWDSWASIRDLKWWVSRDFAPVFMERWIAGVPGKCNPDEHHAVVMGGPNLLLDPNALTQTRWQYVYGGALDYGLIVQAMALVRADQTMPEGNFARIGVPSNGVLLTELDSN